MFNYIDIHSHLYFKDFDFDREEVIARMKNADIATISIGTCLQTSRQSVGLAHIHSNIFACVGMHPGDVVDAVVPPEIDELALDPKVVAIGECGFDYFRIGENGEEIKKSQKKVFEHQIELALKVEKPLMLHCRSSKGSQDAYHDTLEILESYYKEQGGNLRGNAHFFAGDIGVLKRFLDIGFTVSFTGVITFTHDYDDAVRYAPLESLHAETDAPFVAPVPHRGGRNSPEYVPHVVSALARIKEEDEEIVKKTLISNARRLFALPL
ncbi:MAG: TatD family hydrolase [Candidatus Zambryskibacteria bacterium]|nr:TatD family hydrolase [Candidatus Zambryskibacteria bacterium]